MNFNQLAFLASFSVSTFVLADVDLVTINPHSQYREVSHVRANTI